VEKTDQNGFTLIEVLISVFVLALGVIGVAGMQLVALRTSQQSSIQSAAAQLATEMADMMRANPGQMKLADSDNPYLNPANVTYNSATDPAPDTPGKMCYSTAENCSSAELAEFDIYEWKNRIRAALPAGRVTICRDSAPWDSATGALNWSCNAAAGGVNTSLVIKIGWQGKNPDGSLVKNTDGEFPPNVAITVEPYIK
jgi:type IV pilus assembly protein PilV